MIGHEVIGQWTNHLWQSTLFAVVVALVTLAFRKNRAQVRYCLWLSASVKFLVPFALLIDLGSGLWSMFAARQIATELAPPAVSFTMQQIAQPFTDSLSFAPSAPLTHTANWISIAMLSVWICGFLGVALVRFRGWLRIRGAMRASTPIDIRVAAAVRSTPGLLEPGVVGVLRPVLLLPEDIPKRLSPSQLEAVLAHELSHIKRRDNLTAAIHMVVEAVFWFHPFVWWIGARLVEERERACDEAVLSLGGEPRDYADAIVSVCKLYVESPLTCVSGISGADLKKRIVRIIARPVGLRMSVGRKLLLGAAGLLAVAAPVIFGVLNETQTPAQSRVEDSANKLPAFEVASIRPNNSGARAVSIGVPSPGTFKAQNVWLRFLIQVAWDVKDFQVVGGPGWATSDRYDVAAKATENARLPEMRPMLKELLEDRFQLKLHTESRELPIYALVVGKGPVKLRRTSEGSCAMPNPDWPASSPKPLPVCGNISAGPDGVDGIGVSMAQLASSLSNSMQRTVVDQTALTGKFDVQMKWTADQSTPGFWAPGLAPSPSADASTDSGPSIFTVIREQLGLALEARKGPVTVLVIDHIEQPSPN